MRAPNYKVGWLVPGQLAALTHYHADIRQEDILGVFMESQQLLAKVECPFHLLIDNRLAPLDRLYTLAELIKLSPLLQHPYLRYLVVVKPKHLELDAIHAGLQSIGSVSLQNVASVQEGIIFLKRCVADIDVNSIDISFFP